MRLYDCIRYPMIMRLHLFKWEKIPSFHDFSLDHESFSTNSLKCLCNLAS